jgi:hypothetical protein
MYLANFTLLSRGTAGKCFTPPTPRFIRQGQTGRTVASTVKILIGRALPAPRRYRSGCAWFAQMSTASRVVHWNHRTTVLAGAQMPHTSLADGCRCTGDARRKVRLEWQRELSVGLAGRLRAHVTAVASNNCERIACGYRMVRGWSTTVYSTSRL